MYTSNTNLDFNIIWIFEFPFKHTLTSFCLFFIIIKTHTINLIQLVLIKTRFNDFMCFLFSNYFLTSLQEYFINRTVKNIIILFLPAKFISVFGIATAVLIRPDFIILRKKSTPWPCIRLINARWGIWGRCVWIYPLDDIKILFCALQISQSSWSKYFIWQILLSFSFCDQNSWYLP